MPQSFFDKAYLKVVFDRNSPGKVQPDAVILKNDDSSLSVECESVEVARCDGASESIFFYFMAHYALNLVVPGSLISARKRFIEDFFGM